MCTKQLGRLHPVRNPQHRFNALRAREIGVFVILGIFGVSLVHAATEEKKPAPAPAHAPAAKPAAPPASGAAHGPTTTAHGPTTGGSAGHITTTTSSGGNKPTTTTTGGAKPIVPRTVKIIPPAPVHKTPPSPFVAHPAFNGSHEVHAANGAAVRTRADGSRSDIHDPKRGMDIQHGLNGQRRPTVERGDHSRVGADRGGRGYVQHPYMFHGHEFGHRTYYDHGRAYDRFYG